MYSLVGLMHFFGQPTKNVPAFSSVQGSPQVSPVAGTAKAQREPGSRAGEGNQLLGTLRAAQELGGAGQGVLGVRGDACRTEGEDFTGQKEELKTPV